MRVVSMLSCPSRPHLGPSARQIARSVAPGVAPVATRQSIRRNKPFPSTEYASASEKAEATGDPFAPPVRPSAPAGHGRLARTSLRSVYVGLRPRSGPPRGASASPDETASGGAHGRSRGQGARGKRRAEPRRAPHVQSPQVREVNEKACCRAFKVRQFGASKVRQL